MINLRVLPALLFLVCPLLALGDNFNYQEVAKEQQWLYLLHYHKTGFDSHPAGQIDDPNFYLNAKGYEDAEGELRATVRAFKSDERALICQFPARHHWLASNYPELNLPAASCPEFEKWRDTIDAAGLTLIFPAAYLNSPSSMYGHTFIRFDRKSGNNPLLDYSVNFAANANNDDNELVFTYKGLTGGYPGVYSILPYYEKVKEYNHLEARDVWEYELDVNQAEVDQFVRHVWEVKNANIDYYFFDENCSYQLLTLLDASSSRFDFSAQFAFSAIPADTVRVIAESGIIRKAEFRQSELSQLRHMQRNIDSELANVAKSISIPGPDIDSLLTGLSETKAAKTLDLAYKYSRYLAVREKAKIEGLGQHSINLLSKRSKLSVQDVYPIYPEPKVRDDEGHRSRRVGLRHGYDGDSHFQELNIRAAYHDHLDNLSGYLPGAELEMFLLRFRRQYEDGRYDAILKEFSFINIASFTPRDDFIKPVSWHVATGLDRPIYATEELAPYLIAGGGVSYRLLGGLVYFLGDGELFADDDISKGYRLGLGPRLGYLYQHESISSKIEWNAMYSVAGAKIDTKVGTVEFSYGLAKNWQIRLGLEYTEFESRENANFTQSKSGYTLGVQYYY